MFKRVVSDRLFSFGCDRQAAFTIVFFAQITEFFEISNKIVQAVSIVRKLVFLVQLLEPVQCLFNISAGVRDKLFEDLEQLLEL